MRSNRRNFLKTMGIATVCACTGMTGLNSCSMIKGVSNTPPIPSEAIKIDGNVLMVDLNRSEFLNIPGRAGKTFIDNADQTKIIIVHHKPNEFIAFSDRCTHGGRELNYQHDKGQLKCSSFGQSTFKLQNGNVIKGPAEEPLTSYTISKLNHLLEIKIS